VDFQKILTLSLNSIPRYVDRSFGPIKHFVDRHEGFGAEYSAWQQIHAVFLCQGRGK
jgi:hypothetical protein